MDSTMAGKPRNRLELRRQYEAAEPIDPMEDNGDELNDVEADDDGEAKPKKKPKAAPKKPRATKSTKAVKPAARMRVVWQVVSDAFKVVATFDYTQREAAEARAAELTAKGKGTHFIQRAKEAMADDAPGLGASIPRSVPKPTKASTRAAAAVEEPEEEPEDDEDEVEEEPDDSDDDE
jgi:hypothetical protein